MASCFPKNNCSDAGLEPFILRFDDFNLGSQMDAFKRSHS